MDPLADMFIRIKNGYRAGQPSVVLPYSRLKAEVARLLEARRYIAEWEKKGRKVRKFIEVRLRYDGTRPAMQDIRRISKPSQRIYVGRREIRPVRQGMGLLIISTPRGVMSGEEARKSGLGGEMIAEVW